MSNTNPTEEAYRAALRAAATIANVEAEAALLGALLMENSLLNTVGDTVKPEDFAEPVHAKLFEILLDGHQKGHRVTPVTVAPHFTDDPGLKALGGPSYIVRLTADGQGLLAPGSIANQIADLGRRRRMAQAFASAAAGCAAMDRPIEEIMSAATAFADDPDDKEHQATVAEFAARVVDMAGEQIPGVSCDGIPELGRAIGIARPGQFIVVAARPGMGKTAVACSYANDVASRQNGVGFVSLEMRGDELSRRMLADYCYKDGGDNVPYHEILHWKFSGDNRSRVVRAASAMNRLPIIIDDRPSMTISKLDRTIRKMKADFARRWVDLKVVIIDYLGYLSADERYRSRYEEVTEISRALKAMAKRHGIAIIALAQLSREVERRENKRPTLSDLRDSGQIEQDADTVVFLYREEYYLRQTEPKEDDPNRQEWDNKLAACQNQIELITAKRRNGRTGIYTAAFLTEYQSVR